jgi:glycosyltransferase involved in cell wall biosynthesis
VLVVDDGSTDGTAEAAASTGARVIRHGSNRGYGASLKTGIRASSGDVIVITDADGSYPVERIPDLLAALGTSDMAVGARTGSEVHIPNARKPGKWMLRKLAQYVTGAEIPDLNSGLRAFRKDLALQYLNLLPQGFSFTTTITVAAMCDGYAIEYVPVDYHVRTGRSKIRPANFFSFIGLVLRLSVFFRPMRVFMPASVVCFAAGLLKLALDVFFALRQYGSPAALFTREVLSVSSLIFILAGLQIALVGMVAEALARRWAPQVTPRSGRDRGE